MSAHTMHWDDRRQRYACSCGKVFYEGGEHKARAQHRDHKQGIPAAYEVIEAVLLDPNIGYLAPRTQNLVAGWFGSRRTSGREG